MILEDLRYTEAHEWVRDLGDGVVRVGITDHAQSQLGDIVYVSLPDVGAAVKAGAAVGEVESTKSVSDLYSPVDGTVRMVNEELDTDPSLINTSPYEAGWIIELTLADPAGADQLKGLLDAAAYRQLVGE